MVKTQSCLRNKSYRYASAPRMITRRRTSLPKKVHFLQLQDIKRTTNVLRSSAIRSLFMQAKSFDELPHEVVTLILTYFNAKDLIMLRCINRRFKELIDGNSTIWSQVSYQGLWPTSAQEESLFHRGASCSNIECLVKLGLSHLYHYNLISGSEKNEKLVKHNANLAAAYFCQLDTCIAPKKPITWMLIRPPWSNRSVCLKQAIQSQMLEMTSLSTNGAICYNIGRVLALESDIHSKDVSKNFHMSSLDGCSHGAFQELLVQNTSDCDSGRKLQWFRDLKKCVQMKNQEALFMLANFYIVNRQKQCLKEEEATSFCENLFSKNTCIRYDKLETFQPKINSLMRCILVDWLAEVAYMKDMSHQVIHAAVQYVDRYLTTRVIERTKLQLLGITCLLLAAKSHYDPRPQLHILTVRESSWLTDQTYQYEDVVRMMGEIIATFKGDLWMPSSWDYLNLLQSFEEVSLQTKHLSHYLHDLSMLFTCFGSFKPSMLAASCIFLAGIILNNECPWLNCFEEYTGFVVKDVANCASLLYYKCILCPSIKDDRDLPLKSIKDEYCSEKYDCIAKIVVAQPCEIKHRILAADSNLTCISQDPFQFDIISMDETLNLSIKSIDYDGDCDEDSDAFSESFEETFCVGRTKSLSFVEEFSDDETMDADTKIFNKSMVEYKSYTPIYNNASSRYTRIEKKWLSEGTFNDHMKSSEESDILTFFDENNIDKPPTNVKCFVSASRKRSNKRKTVSLTTDPIGKRTRSSRFRKN
ncbi:cyclin-F isoform X1 [Hydra vulgaris]|uniref:cyclin-F isoform X1 n=1 Tax=Hydra vulgaris TaxID=6087 RepID=UPI000641407D|nr:cyclin-F [Hydra vulgaris]